MNEIFIGRQRFFWPGQGQYLNFWQFSQTILGEQYVLFFNCVYNIRIHTHLFRWSKSKQNLRMAKVKKTKPKTTTAWELLTLGIIINKNQNSPSQTKITYLNEPLNLKIGKQDLLLRKQFLKILWSDVQKGRFHLFLIHNDQKGYKLSYCTSFGLGL